jgi:hypothetical protein
LAGLSKLPTWSTRIDGKYSEEDTVITGSPSKFQRAFAQLTARRKANPDYSYEKKVSHTVTETRASGRAGT